MQIFKWLASGDGTLALASPKDAVQRVLALTRLDDVFPLYPSVDEAVTKLTDN